MLADMLLLAAILPRPMHGYEIKKTCDQNLVRVLKYQESQPIERRKGAPKRPIGKQEEQIRSILNVMKERGNIYEDCHS
jgi:shikimate kinase